MWLKRYALCIIMNMFIKSGEMMNGIRRKCESMGQKIFEALRVDLVEVETAFAGQVGIYLKYLKRFAADDTFAGLCDAVSRGELSEVERAAHALKGVCATLRLNALCEMAKELDALARQGNMEEIRARMPELLKEYSRVSLEIERYA